MKIVSKYPQLWPHLGFALAAGDNEIDEKTIPLAAHAKLAAYQASGVISGYTPSGALVSAAEAHARKARVKPPVATLETVASSAPAPAPEKKPEEHDQHKRK